MAGSCAVVAGSWGAAGAAGAFGASGSDIAGTSVEGAGTGSVVVSVGACTDGGSPSTAAGVAFAADDVVAPGAAARRVRPGRATGAAE